MSCIIRVNTRRVQLGLRARRGGAASGARRLDEAPQEDERVGRRQPGRRTGGALWAGPCIVRLSGASAVCRRLPASQLQVASLRQRKPVRPGGLPEVEGREDVSLHPQEVLLAVRAVRNVTPVVAPVKSKRWVATRFLGSHMALVALDRSPRPSRRVDMTASPRGAGLSTKLRYSGAKISSYLDAMNIAAMPTSCSLSLMTCSFSR